MGLFAYRSIPGKLGIRNSKDDTMECLSIIVRLTCFKYRVIFFFFEKRGKGTP